MLMSKFSDKMKSIYAEEKKLKAKKPRTSLLDATIAEVNGTAKQYREHKAKVDKYDAEKAERKKSGISEEDWSIAQRNAKEDNEKMNRWLKEPRKKGKK